jgi:hypothetical protein
MADTGATTELVVVTTNASDRRDICALLAEQLPRGTVVTCPGYFAGVAALEAGHRIVVIEVPAGAGAASWRLAELRARSGEATVIVVADAMDLHALKGALHADLAVTSASSLPPLRELLVSHAVVPDGQTMLRRRTR